MEKFKSKWIADMLPLVKLRYPLINKERIDELLDNIYEKTIKKEKLIMQDTYRNITYESDTRQLLEYCEVKKPLLAGNGVLFDADKNNPAIKMLNKIKQKRNFYKAKMKTYEPDSYGFALNNLYQGNEKVKMNAW